MLENGKQIVRRLIQRTLDRKREDKIANVIYTQFFLLIQSKKNDYTSETKLFLTKMKLDDFILRVTNLNLFFHRGIDSYQIEIICKLIPLNGFDRRLEEIMESLEHDFFVLKRSMDSAGFSLFLDDQFLEHCDSKLFESDNIIRDLVEDIKGIEKWYKSKNIESTSVEFFNEQIRLSDEGNVWVPSLSESDWSLHQVDNVNYQASRRGLSVHFDRNMNVQNMWMVFEWKTYVEKYPENVARKVGLCTHQYTFDGKLHSCEDSSGVFIY